LDRFGRNFYFSTIGKRGMPFYFDFSTEQSKYDRILKPSIVHRHNSEKVLKKMRQRPRGKNKQENRPVPMKNNEALGRLCATSNGTPPHTYSYMCVNRTELHAENSFPLRTHRQRSLRAATAVSAVVRYQLIYTLRLRTTTSTRVYVFFTGDLTEFRVTVIKK
jgi:hypothetical protein